MTETDPVAERPRVHVGLTGGIAAGKSAVARVLQERGALLVDSDALARLVLEKGTDGLAAVQDEFGDRVITADGELDRVETYRGMTVKMELADKVRFEIAVSDEFVQPTIDALCRGAQTGQVGDGKIFVMDIEQAVRIRTGETNTEAL